MEKNDLVIDIGNTKLKWGMFKKNILITNGSFLLSEEQEFISFFKSLTNSCSDCIVSASGKIFFELSHMLEERFKTLLFNASVKLPFSNLYATPNSLGLDRMANAAAAFTKYPAKDCLIIDAGTCITYDFLSAEGEYLGGAISPGLQMRFKAMHTFTAKLPLIKQVGEIQHNNYKGLSTLESMKIGVIEGMIHEIDGFIQQYLNDYKDLTIIFTGGDALYLSTRLKNSIFVDLNFQLKGLHTILEHHKANA